MTQLMIVSIGPVQSYIAQARRTQDLWHGSQMLSYLAEAGTRWVMNNGCELIFPDPNLLNHANNSIPNRFMFTTEGNPADIAKDLERAINNAWQMVAAGTADYFDDLAGAAGFHDPSQWRTIWLRQVNSWLEFYWIGVPYRDVEPEDYSLTLIAANRAMVARKLLRDFNNSSAEQGHKCSLTGEHEALHTDQQHRASEIRDGFWEPIRKKHPNQGLLRQGERLCALSVIKRMAHECNPNLEPRIENDGESIPHRFPSTSSISASDFRTQVIGAWEQCRGAVGNYLKALEALFHKDCDLYFCRKGKFNPEAFPYIQNLIGGREEDYKLLEKFLSLDGDWLYEDTLILRTLDEYGAKKNVDPAPARNALKELYDAVEKRPSPYLAILALDGDKIGSFVNTLASRRLHETFSRALADFARGAVTDIVEQSHPGRLIYSGGDDVLALFPIEHALPAAKEIRDTFMRKMDEAGFEGLTASAGVAFVHRTQPLQRAIQATRNAEHRAKDYYKRDALVVDFIRRSGEQETVGSKWSIEGYDLVGNLQSRINEFRNKDMSLNIPYEIDRIHYEMAGNIVAPEAREAELERILKRRAADRLDRDQKIELAGRWVKLIQNIAEPPTSHYRASWDDAVGWLKLARFIAKGGRD